MQLFFMLAVFYVSPSLLWATLSHWLLLNCAWGLHLGTAWEYKRTCCSLLRTDPSAPSAPLLHFTINSLSVSLITACTHCVMLVCTGVTSVHHRKDSPHFWNPQSSFFWQEKWPTALGEGWCLIFFFSLLVQHVCFHLPYHCVWMHTHLWHCCHPNFIFPHKTFVVNFLGAL